RWDSSRGPAGDQLVQMATAPDDPKHLYAAGYHSLAESHDGGVHWTPRKAPMEGSPVTSLMPLSGGMLLAGTATGLYRASETGTWLLVANGSFQSIQRSPNNAIAAITGAGAMVSTDNGQAWMNCGNAGEGPWYGVSFDLDKSHQSEV